MLTCYLDESGTDSNSPIATVAGIVLDMDDFFWSDIAWRKAIGELNVELQEPLLSFPFHMKDFGKHGKLGHLRDRARRVIFTKLVKVINKHKGISVSGRLDSAAYSKIFKGLTAFTMYGSAFLNVAALISKESLKQGYGEEIAYTLDCGNAHYKDILEVKSFFAASNYQAQIGFVGFEDDHKLSALQIADVVSFAVRRKHDQGLNSGYEPMEGIFTDKHEEVVYEESVMMKVAADLRNKQIST